MTWLDWYGFMLRERAGQDVALATWCEKYKDNASVKRWLATDPPPAKWEGSALEWAYTEMPVFQIEDEEV